MYRQNIIAERYQFSKLEQLSNEYLEDFKNKLRIQSERCQFTDRDYQICDQIVFKCTSAKLRCAALKHGWDFKEFMKEDVNSK